MTKQEAVIKYITENYLEYNRLRHDVISDKLQLRMDMRSDRPTGCQKSDHCVVGTGITLSDPLSPTANIMSVPTVSDANGLSSCREAFFERERSVWREMTKQDINSIVCHCAQEYDTNITSREVITALQSDLIPNVHPLREYILSLRPYTPDQPDWIDMLAQKVVVKDDEQAYWRKCFKKWFVAMVASWMHDDVVNHTVLVLIGRQGIYKTTWLDRLIPPELSAYSSKLPLSGQISKDDRLRLCENGMLNIDELDAICGREMNIVKSLLTSTDVNERAAYGRLKERRVRLASL
jgi:predicted P-loop ATPase